MSGYIGTQPIPQATQTRDSFTATASQTSFATGGYTPNFLDVYLNGLKLNSSQFTATNGTDVVLTSAASSGDIVEVIAYTAFEVANASFDDLALGGNLTVGGTVDGRDIAADGTKLDGIESGATGDQTNAEIRAAVEAATDSNVFTDADHTKLNAIEASATADQTASEIRTLVESATDSNVFTDADHTKLNSIESGATADQTKSDIDALNINADTLDGQHGSYYTGYADTAVANIVDSAPGTLDTLNELAAALGDDPNFATTVTNSIATKLPLAGGTLTGNLSFGDNDKAIFGAGSDLQIYHDGSDSYISEGGDGDLLIRTNGTGIRLQKNNGENMLKALTDGAVQLYYDNQDKLATTSTGIDVTGTVTADGLTVETSASDTGVDLVLDGNKTSNGGIGSIIFNNNGDSVGMIRSNRASANDAADLLFYTQETGGANTKRLNIANNGDISFYEDTGTTAKFFWDASAESLGIGTSSPKESAGLHIQGSNGSSGANANVAANEVFIDNNGDTGITLGSSATGLGTYAFADSTVALRGAIQYDHSDDSMNFRVSSSDRMHIDSSGNLLVGKSAMSGSTAGLQVKPAGELSVVRDANHSLILNRKSSDGNIALFQKDGTTVGSLGASGGDFTVNAQSLGLLSVGGSGKYAWNNSFIYPVNNNTSDLGTSSFRFKDLYLSGLAYTNKVVTQTIFREGADGSLEITLL